MQQPGQHSPGYLQQYRGDECISVAAAFTALVIAAVAVRFVAKTKIKAALAMDDYLILPALVRR